MAITMRFKQIILIVSIVAMSIACSSGGGADQYLQNIGDALGSASDALDEWSSLADEAAVMDYRKMSRNQIVELVERQLVLARQAKKGHSEALTILMKEIPPEQCKAVHIAMVEALQLGERGFLEMISYFSSALDRGYDDEDAMTRANDLLNQADLVKQRSLGDLSECS